MEVITGAISKANFFKIRHGILSGSNFATPSWLSWSWSLSGYEWPSSLGMENVSSHVKTEVNSSSIICALVLLSVWSTTWCFNGGIPKLSWRCAFTNFQKGRVLLSSKPYWITVFMYCHLARFCSLAVDFLNCLNVDHEPGSLLDFAFVYSLCFRRDFLRCSTDIQGKFWRLDVVFQHTLQTSLRLQNEISILITYDSSRLRRSIYSARDSRTLTTWYMYHDVRWDIVSFSASVRKAVAGLWSAEK